jgi:FkbM family methyltransferase
MIHVYSYAMRKFIIDFGANRGQNLEYFLKRADLVIAVEANPTLCEFIEKEFANYVANGQLIVENCAVSEKDSKEGLVFYIHKTRDYLSTSINQERNPNYKKILIKAKSPGTIIREHTKPADSFLYAKFDLEGFDSIALNKMVSQGYVSDFISIEAHTVDCLVAILNIREVKGLKLLEGTDIVKKYSSANILTLNETIEKFSFKLHSSGPFGDDIAGQWLDKRIFLDYFLLKRFGWKDIHATTLERQLTSDLPIIFSIRMGFVMYVKLIWQNTIPLSVRDSIHYQIRKVRQILQLS